VGEIKPRKMDSVLHGNARGRYDSVNLYASAEEQIHNHCPPAVYRIVKLWAIAAAATPPHTKNPIGYPDGLSCVLTAHSWIRDA